MIVLGHHNVAGSIDYSNYMKEEYFDSLLSPLGEEQCREVSVNETIQSNVANSQLVLVSPLRRTLQTALQCFPHFINKIPFISIENIREQSGLHPCDRRNTITDQSCTFPEVDFSEIVSDKDPIYDLYPGVREPEDEVMARALNAIEYIITRKEKEIIVVSHSSYLSKLLQTFHINKQFQNAEVASYVIQYIL
jgi:broad specificity phosphatase PhoE